MAERTTIMLFNSIEFLFVFLPVTFIVYFALNKARLINLATGWLVVASLFFYSYWKIDYLPLILISMVFNYTVGYTLSHKSTLKLNRKAILGFGVIGNISLLCYFKYFDFLINNINLVLHSGFDTLKIALPLGISFFTFTQIAYLVDAYKKEVREYDFLNYALFVTFFPHLIAGPILHHSEMMPQFADIKKKVINHKYISMGLFLIALGLFKKVMIADYLSPFVKQMFDVVPSLTFFEAWVASLAYTFQLYFDFSGYCDMAIGIAFLFNIKLPINFNSPYKAANIQDFWRRWHMTLSRFLRNYIYIPLGGNRFGSLVTYRNLFLTFLIGGIWHGANWTFIIWGMMHGFATCIHRLWRELNININHKIAVAITFVFINFTWVFFRAPSLHKALDIIKSMFGLNGFAPVEINKMRFAFENGSIKISLILLSACIILTFLFKNSNHWAEKFKPTKVHQIITIILLLVSILSINKVSEFLYFQF